jgi:hypothetical protein
MEEYNKELVEAWYQSSKIKDLHIKGEPFLIDTFQPHEDVFEDRNFDFLYFIDHDKIGVTGDVQKALIKYASNTLNKYMKDYIETVLGNCSSHVYSDIRIEYDSIPFMGIFYPPITINLNDKEPYLTECGLCFTQKGNGIEVRPVNPSTMGIDAFIKRYYEFVKSLEDQFDWDIKGDLWKFIGYHDQCNDEIGGKTIKRMAKLNLGLCVTVWQVG